MWGTMPDGTAVASSCSISSSA